MKIIPKPDLSAAEILSPAQMNKIHFGGNHTPLTAAQLKALAEAAPAETVCKPKAEAQAR